jgi:hypothetical protein
VARVRQRRRIIAAVVALAVIVGVVAIGISVAGHRSLQVATPPPSSASIATTPTTAPPPPSAADIAAARACEAFVVYLADAQSGEVPAAAGRDLIEDAAVLLRGANADKAAERALPRWSGLGADLLDAAEDVVEHNSEALETDGAAAGAQCRTVSASAARAGGFSRSAA